MYALQPLLAAAFFGSLAMAGDVCPPTYCSIGDRCGYAPNGPHCCGAGNDQNVLQCVSGKWALRNKCTGSQFCTCTGSHDLVCRNNDALAASAASAAEAANSTSAA